MHEPARRITFALIFLLPIALGAESLILTSLYVVSCLLTAVSSLTTQNKTRIPFVLVTPFLLVSLYLLLQIIPLPPKLLMQTSPLTGHALAETIWAIDARTWMPLALNFEQSYMALLFVAAIGSLCLTISQLISGQGHNIIFARIINRVFAGWIIMGLILSVLSHTMPGEMPLWEGLQGKIAGIRESSHRWLICFLPVVMAGYGRSGHTKRHSASSVLIGKQVRSGKTLHDLNERGIVIAAVLTLLVAPCWSELVLLVAALVIYQSLIMDRKGPVKKILLGGVAVFSTGLFFVFPRLHVGSQLLPTGNLHIMSTTGSTGHEWLKTWFGYGLGGHFDLTLKEPVSAGMQLLLGVGWGGLVLLMIVLAFWLRYSRSIGQGNPGNPNRRRLAAGMTGLFCLFLLALNKHNNMTWEELFAIGSLIAIWVISSRLSQEAASTSGHWLASFVRPALCVLLSVSLVFIIPFYVSTCLASRFDPRIEALHAGDLDPSQPQDMQRSIEGLMSWFPYSRSGRFIEHIGYLAYYQMDDERARNAFRRSLQNNPLNPDIILALSSLYASTGPQEMVVKLLESAPMTSYLPDPFFDRTMTRLIRFKGNDGRTSVLRKVMEIWPDYSDKLFIMMHIEEWNNDEIEGVLPEKPAVWVHYGHFLLARGESEKGEQACQRGFVMTKQSGTADEWPYAAIATCFLKAGQFDKAVTAVDTGVRQGAKDARLKQVQIEIYRQVKPR